MTIISIEEVSTEKLADISENIESKEIIDIGCVIINHGHHTSMGEVVGISGIDGQAVLIRLH